MLDYAWICLNISEYAGLYVNILKSAWISFVLHTPIVILCLLERVITYFNEYFSLKGDEAVFLKRQKLIFSIVAGSILFVFWFRPNIFRSKILNSLLPLGPEGTGTWGRDLWILIYPKYASYVFKIILKLVVNFKVVNSCKFWYNALICVFLEFGACLPISEAHSTIGYNIFQ